METGSSIPLLSVVLPTHNANPRRLERTLGGLNAQTLPPDRWECIVVDNASTPPLGMPATANLRVVREHRLGLTHARLRGLAESSAGIIVMVDDDNVLSPGHLAAVVRLFTDNPKLGAAGGPVLPEWERPPPAWALEFRALFALCDHGPEPLLQAGGPGVPWPDFAPVGAGLCLRREAAACYVRAVQDDSSRLRFDRSGASLASGGDNDIVFSILHAGWSVGYFPQLALTHLIPAARLEPEYIARLNEGIMQTWVQVLALHGQCPWPAVPPWTLPLRIARAWWLTRAWRSPAHHVRWRGRVGQFRGQAALHRAGLRGRQLVRARNSAGQEARGAP